MVKFGKIFVAYRKFSSFRVASAFEKVLTRRSTALPLRSNTNLSYLKFLSFKVFSITMK